MFQKRRQSDESPIDKLPPEEFVERIAKILLVCIEGIQELLPGKDPLIEELKHLGRVVSRVTRPRPATGTARDLGGLFLRLKLEQQFHHLDTHISD